MLEKTVEAYLVERVRALGGTAYKFTSPARASVPDRIVILPPGRIYFVELKRPGGKLTRGQEREHEHLRRLGADVRMLDSIGAINAFLNGVQAVAADEATAPVPMGAISRILDEVMQRASENGADSRSMPDDYVAVAHFTCYPEKYRYGTSADSNCTCGMKLGHARHCAAFDESMVRYEPFGEKPAKTDERAAFEIAMQEPLRKLVGDAAASMARYGDAYDSDFVDAAWLAWQVARASQAAAPAEAREPHADDVAVDEFAIEMKAKMAAARAKGRSGWETCAPADLSRMLREHVEKGDPRGVANFCMMLHHHGAHISASAEARLPSAWVTPENDRAITQSQKQGMLRDGGASASSVRPYSIACYAGSAPADAGEAVLPPKRVEEIMAQAQVFASAWSLVGGRFDQGDALETAEQEKQNLRDLVSGAQGGKGGKA
ncbi:VRR-NUC domain-containing protein [Burkholderia gladioli]|uniref:VRR-NUC domain-containing protein n=1 Tax=Burkholderia gladioli TaxID=28095 RepID=UPI001ABA77BB|nr:VRR-NUC domain-containing protein [Burkholderia gladioli]